jgi:hypothetical protein
LGESESSVVIVLIVLIDDEEDPLDDKEDPLDDKEDPIDDEEDPIDDADLPRFSRFEELLERFEEFLELIDDGDLDSVLDRLLFDILRRFNCPTNCVYIIFLYINGVHSKSKHSWQLCLRAKCLPRTTRLYVFPKIRILWHRPSSLFPWEWTGRNENRGSEFGREFVRY